MAEPTNIDLPPDSWLVALAPDETVTLTLDELDAAYNEGRVSERTLVWTHGMDEWLPLEDAAGGDAEEEVVPEPVPAAAVAPVAPPAVIAPSASIAPQVAAAPSVSPAAALGTHDDAIIAPSPSFPPISAAPMSTAPVAFNLEDLAEVDEDAFATKKKSKLGILLAAAAVCGVAGLTLVNLGGAGDESSSAAAQPVAGKAVSPADEPLALGESKGYQVTASEDRAIEAQAKKDKEIKEKMELALSEKKAEPARPRRTGGSSRKAKPAKVKRVKDKASGYDPLNGDLP